MSTQIFDFSAKSGPQATSIVVSKADTLDRLESKIRSTLGLSLEGQIRCYKYPVKRSDFISWEIDTKFVSRMVLDRDDLIDFTLRSRTVGEVGIVEPYVAIAVEWKALGGSWPMDDESSSSSEESSIQGASTSTDMVPMNSGGRTLGASPNSFTALNYRGRFSNEKARGDSDDEYPLGTLNGQPVSGPVLPGSYPRTSPPNSFLRSSSTDRFGERYKTSFNSRLNQQPSYTREERARGTTGLNNLGNPKHNICFLMHIR